MTTNSIIRRDARIELTFGPDSDLVSVTRDYVSAFYKRVLSDQDLIWRVGMVTHELLENGVKYSTDGMTTIIVEAKNGTENGKISVCLKNRVDPSRAARLREVVAAMENEPNALAHYEMLIQQNALLENGSGLGLARIWAEGQMKIRCVFEEEYVSIIAETNVAGRGPK